MNKRNITNIKKGLIITGSVLILVLGVRWIIKWLKIDACLDKGGRWNYEKRRCEYPETVYRLTEVDSIKYVKYEMNYGSHANTGVNSRDDYKAISSPITLIS